MIALLGLVRSPLGIASCVALGLAVTTAICYRGWQNAREEVGEYRARLETQVGATETAVRANASNATTITDLETRLRDMTAARQLEREQRDLELAARDRALQTARNESARLRRQLSTEWAATNDCTQLAAIDVARVCPGIAQRLRERAAGH